MSEAFSPKITSLRTYRGQLGYSQQMLASVLGCSERAVQRLEAGGLPDFLTALKLELLYHVPLQQLFTGIYDRLREQFRPLPPTATAPVTIENERAKSGRRSCILAIDPSAKALGLAVLERDTLRYSGVRYLPQQPLPDRLLRDGLSIVETFVDRYRPHTIVLPFMAGTGSTRSPHVRRFCWCLRKLALRHGLRFVECGPHQISAALDNRATHDHRARLIAERWPALESKLPQKRRAWEGPNARMLEFSAIALALTAAARAKARVSKRVAA